jgi:cell division septum initiation protein DivIVA
MSHFHRQGTQLEEHEESREQDQPRSPFADVAGRFANWFTGIDRAHEQAPGSAYETDPDPLRALTTDPEAERGPSRFPVAPLGYNRTVVDEHLADLERELAELGRELAELRAHREAPMTVTEELERIGEQTASILVVAHDKAHETTRRAEEQAERCIADAAANAVAITEEAKQRLCELDNETDSVWRERERLLEDVRAVSSALAALADQASERFPAAADQPATGAFPAAPSRAHRVAAPRPFAPRSFVPQDTASFTAREEADAGYGADVSTEPEGDPGDTASWLAGFEPSAPDDTTHS